MFVSTTVVSTRSRAPRVYPPLPGDLHHALQRGLQGVGAQEVRQSDQGLRIRNTLAIDSAEGAVHEAASHLALAFVEAPVPEMFQQECAQDNSGGRAEPPAASDCQRRAAGQMAPAARARM